MARSDLASRSLYLCTPDRPDVEQFVAACIEGGVDVVQLRDKALEARPLLDRARAVAAVCADHGVPFVLNDRPDLALDIEGAGVHVGQDDAPPELARRVVGDDRIVGLSTHAPLELERSASAPVDYLSVGPVEPTPTKPGRPGTGLDYVRLASSQMERPWFVTGGVTPGTIPTLAAAGARRFVVVRYLTESDEPGAAARRLRDAIERVVEAD